MLPDLAFSQFFCRSPQMTGGYSMHVLTARVPGAQPSDTWQRGSLRSSHAMIVASVLYCSPLMELTR